VRVYTDLNFVLLSRCIINIVIIIIITDIFRFIVITTTGTYIASTYLYTKENNLT
jgi:hypothetical protein